MPNGLLLVVHHRYIDGLAFDLSDNQNHGTVVDAENRGSSLAFNRPTSRIDVPPSESLENLIAVCAGATFRLNRDVNHRQNLVEGHLSFSLHVNTDGSLSGTILDRFGDWRGGQTGPGLIQPDTWHNAQMMHDGLSQLQLVVDDRVVGTFGGVFGAVRSVSANGVAIGTWPEHDPRYVLEGELREAFVCRLDLTPPIQPPKSKKSDPADYPAPGEDFFPAEDDRADERTVASGPVAPAVIGEMMAKIIDKGWNAEALETLVRETEAIGRDMIVLLRGSDRSRTGDTAEVERRAYELLLHGSGPDPSLQDRVVEGDLVDAVAWDSVQRRFWKVMRRLPIDGEAAVRLADALGMGFLVRDRDAAIQAFSDVRDLRNRS